MSFSKLTGPLQANHQELLDARLHQFSGAKADALAGEVYEDTTIDTPMFVSDSGHLPILAAGSGTPADIGVNDTASAGTSTRGARLDHKHKSPNVATTSAAGFMSSGDKTKLDGIAANANNYVHPNHSGDVASVADGATTIQPNVVSNSKLADMATATFKGRSSAGSGDPEDLSVAQVKTTLGLAAIASSGSASDLVAGTVPSARFDDTSHGSRSGGSLHALATSVAHGFMPSTDKVKLDGASDIATPSQLAKYDANGRLIVEDAVSGKQAVNWQTMLAQIALNQQGLAEKDPVRGLFTSLPTYTYSSGTKRITASANGALAATADGVGSWAVNDRIFFTGVIGTGSTNAGLYKIIQVGTASLPFVLERTSDFGGPGAPVGQRLIGALVQVLEGSEHGDTFWVLTNDSVTLDTTVLVFRKRVAADVDNATIEVDSSGNLRTKDGGQTNAKLANMAQETIKGRAVGAGSGAPQDLTPAQAWAVIAKGATAGGTIAAGQVLRGDTTNGVDADAGLTTAQTGAVTTGVGIGDSATSATVSLGMQAAAGSNAVQRWYDGAIQRWQIAKLASQNMDMVFRALDASGNVIDDPIQLQNASGSAVVIGGAGATKRPIQSTHQAGTGVRLVEAAADGTQSATAAITTAAKGLLDDADYATMRTTLGIAGAERIDRPLKTGAGAGYVKIATITLTTQYHYASFTALVHESGGESSATARGAHLLHVRIKQQSPMSSPLDYAQVYYASLAGANVTFGYVVEQDDAFAKVVTIYSTVSNASHLYYSVLAKNVITASLSFFESQAPVTIPAGYTAATPASFSAGALTSSTLTAGRVPRVSTGGLLVDDAGLTASTNAGVTNGLQVGDGVSSMDADIFTNVAAGQYGGLRFREAGITKAMFRRISTGAVELEFNGVDIPFAVANTAGSPIVLGGAGATKRPIRSTACAGTGTRVVVAAANGDFTATQTIEEAVSGLSYKSNIGDGANATIVKAHGLGTADLDVSLTEIATGEKVGCRTVVDSTNVTLYFGSAPAINSYRLLVRKI